MIRHIAITTLLMLASPALRADTPLSLWEVPGQSNTVYILGSVHLLREQDHPLASRIGEVYDEAEVLYMEIDMDDLDPLAAQAAVNRLGVLKDDTTLASLLGAEAYGAAIAAARDVDIPIKLLEKTEPWLAAITVEQMMLARLGFNPAYGVEMTMLAKAAADGKPIYGFEELEEQLAFLDGLSMSAQTDMLLQTLSESAKLEGLMDGLIDAWKTGDIAFFEETILEDMQDYPELYRVIVSERNERWVETIEGLLQNEDDYLIIVGALHLVGDDGVPTLLENRGYEVSQMREAAR